MNSKMIVIDGKTYNSVEEMPPDIRLKYEQAMGSLGDAHKNQIPDAFGTTNMFADQDKDGIPDVLENLTTGHTAVRMVKVIVAGKEFDGLTHLPPDLRAKYEEAMGKLDSDRNGVPDFAEGIINTANQNVMFVSNTATETPRHLAPVPINSTITPDTSNGWMLVVGGLFIFFLGIAGAGVLWYFFLR